MLTDEQMEDKIDEIKNKISKEIHISRVPPKTYNRFKEFAGTDFCNDYGLCLKHLLDFYDGLIPTGLEGIEIRLAALEEEVAGLTQKQETAPVKVIKMANGTERRMS
jgi:hypothetical protein